VARAGGGRRTWPSSAKPSTFEIVFQVQIADLYLTSETGDVFTNPLFLFATCFPGKACLVTSELPTVGGRSVEVWISPEPARQFASPYAYSPNSAIQLIPMDILIQRL
jgi:hypothetical protein